MENRLLWVLLGFGLGVTLLVYSRSDRHEFKSRNWMLFRALFPSWRFFEDLVWVPKLTMRVDDSGPWILCFPGEKRKFHSLFLNSRGNMRMAALSLVEQFVHDLEGFKDGEETRKSVSYQLLVRLVRFRIRELAFAKVGAQFQFKIESVNPGQAEHEEGETLMISGIHDV